MRKFNKKQKEIIKELREISENIGYSLKRRDCSWELYFECVDEFGFFNNAKQKAGLIIRNVRILDFPKEVFNLDKDMARIASYLTFDGHIYKDLSTFFYSSINIKDLEEFEKIIKRKFKISGKYYFNCGGIKKQTHCYYVFNKRLCNELVKIGIPSGEKVTQRFNVPKWIVDSKELTREYLRIAYLCEGSMKESNRTPRIQISTAKVGEMLDSGFEFMETLRIMLNKFNIETTPCNIMGNRIRKSDGKISKDIRFRIKIADNNKFIKNIGWLK